MPTLTHDADVALNAVVMEDSKFYHIGTMAEYVDHYCDGKPGHVRQPRYLMAVVRAKGTNATTDVLFFFWKKNITFPTRPETFLAEITGSRVVASAVHPDASVAADAVVMQSVVCPGAAVGSRAVVDWAVIGDNAGTESPICFYHYYYYYHYYFLLQLFNFHYCDTSVAVVDLVYLSSARPGCEAVVGASAVVSHTVIPDGSVVPPATLVYTASVPRAAHPGSFVWLLWFAVRHGLRSCACLLFAFCFEFLIPHSRF